MAEAAALLFDLDGTFADTAPDLGAALNRLRADLNLPPVALELLRPHTSSGVRGMLGAGLDILPGDTRYAELYQRYLRFYAEALCVHTTVFPGIDGLLSGLEARGVPWGIITNKTQRFTLRCLNSWVTPSAPTALSAATHRHAPSPQRTPCASPAA